MESNNIAKINFDNRPYYKISKVRPTVGWIVDVQKDFKHSGVSYWKSKTDHRTIRKPVLNESKVILCLESFHPQQSDDSCFLFSRIHKHVH